MRNAEQTASVVLVDDAHPDFFDTVEQALVAQGVATRRAASAEALLVDADALREAQVICAIGAVPVTREVMAAAPNLRAVISPVTGIEAFDVPAATELGVVVANGAVKENYESMAESGVLLILACCYNLAGKEKALREGQPNPPPQGGRMLAGKTVGLFGYGSIARHIVKLLEGWGVRFLVVSRRKPAGLPPCATHVTLDEMLAQSDVNCVLAPLTDETRSLLDHAKLASTKAGSALVVLSRGGIVDEDAVVELVRQGHFSNVALDVFAQEPLPMSSPLRSLPQTILTNHAVGHTRETVERIVPACVESVLSVLNGQMPDRVVNAEVSRRWA